MTTLFDVLVATLRELEALHEAPATGGAVGYLDDSKLPTLGWNANDAFNGGTLLLIYDAGGAGAAPQGESRVVGDYDGTSGRIGVDTNFSAAPAAGDYYGVAHSRYPRGLVVSKVNEALRELGDVPTEDTTSVTTASDTREYDLPVAAKRDLREVWVAQDTAAPWQWKRVMGAYLEHGAANAVGKLIFPYQPDAGYKVKLVYLGPHAYVSADTDKISDYLSVDLLALAAAVKCARFRLEQPGSDDAALVRLINDLMARAARAGARKRPIAIPATAPILPFTEVS